ncbi:MAG: hypothetical protein LAP40_26145 [Acidobacteriia bacterium]|nr:hypothetical protein [Terriglobia bacterium]
MLRIPSTIGTLTMLFLLAATANGQKLSGPAASCPVTRAPQPAFVPAVPNRGGAVWGNGFFYGDENLFTEIQSVWTGLPHWETGYRQKIVWWIRGYDWKAQPSPDLRIEGRRLDAPAPPLIVTGANGSYTPDMGSFVMSGVNFPTEGCWEVTGRSKTAALTFVVCVE